MDQYDPRGLGVHEGSTLLSSRQATITADGLHSAESPIFTVTADSASNRDAWKEFECRRNSAEFYLKDYLNTMDRITHSCTDFDTGPTQVLSNTSRSQDNRDVAHAKICTDTVIRDLIVMENILLWTKDNPKLQRQPLSSTAAFCTCALGISALLSPLKAAAIASGVGAAVGGMALIAPSIWLCVQCYHINNALYKVKALKQAFADNEIYEGNKDDLKRSHFLGLERTVRNGSREIDDS